MEKIFMAFLIGGSLSLIAQLILNIFEHKITGIHILIIYIAGGTILSALGWYKHLVNLAGAGALVPISGLGHLMTQGTIQSVSERGLLGVFAGGIESVAAIFAVLIISAYLMAILFNPKD